MYPSVQRHPIVGGHAVFRIIKRFLIALVKELRSPVHAGRRHWPLDGGLRCAVGSFYPHRVAILISPDRHGIVHILTVEIQGLGYDLPILLGQRRHILAEILHCFFRIMAKEYRIGPKSDIPDCSIKVVIRQYEIGSSGCLYIFFTLAFRIVKSAAGCAAYFNGRLSMAAKLLYSPAVGF